MANGDLKRKLTVQVKGEVAALADTINGMIDTLAIFADQVTTVAREVGVEGKLGGQADVPGAAGTWKDLTDNVNELAANLTGQVRAIADVATAVTKGDLTRSIGVEARGEVAELKDNINQMIANLRDTTRKNTEQDWLKTNLAKFTRLLQGQREMVAVAKLILNELSPLVSAQHGVFYITEKEGEGETPVLKLLSSYAYNARRGLNNRFHLGEGLVGQCALEKERIVVTDVPRNYVRIGSGLGNGRPRNIVVIPINFEGEVKAVIELASFNAFTDIHLAFLDQLTEGIGIVLNTISAGMRTEELLKQSQSLAEELQSQQEELKEKNARLEQQTATLRDSEELLKQQQDQLQGTNQELEEKARMLASQKAEVETKNHQIELARKALQEKAEQLALTSKYKSEFLANMSHELRTPLNSLLILSKLLGDNVARNLTPKQLEYAQTIHDSGAHLLSLINDILDMAKIESGTMAVDLEAVPLAQVRRELEHTFLQVAQQKELGFTVTIDPGVPQAIHTDAKRLQQVLNNLVSNACKFTERGSVEVRIAPAPAGWSTDHATLSRVTDVIAFAVRDTGIGIAPEKLRLVFEPFQQADMGTARKYGGTGLGLSISREIAHLLGGEIGLESTPGQGSTFTLYLPSSWPFHLPGLTATPARAGNGPAALVPATQAERASSRPRGVEPWAGKVDQLGPEVERTTACQEDQVKHVLVVEDNDIERLGITALLGDGTVKTTAVATGAEALAIVRAEHVDVLVLDLRLPDISGFDVLREVAGQPDDRNTRGRDLYRHRPDAGASGDVAAVEGEADPQDPDFSHRTARHGQSLPEAGAA